MKKLINYKRAIKWPALAAAMTLMMISVNSNAEYRGANDFSTFRQGVIKNADTWSSGDVALYVPGGKVPKEIGTKWVKWYDEVDQLYKKISIHSSFNNVYRRYDSNFKRRMKAIGYVNKSCGFGCGNKQQAETTFNIAQRVKNSNNWSDHWVVFYEMGRGGSGEPFKGRAMWPTSTTILPHTMAGVAFHHFGGDAGMNKGTPGHLLNRLKDWEKSGKKWTKNFVKKDESSQGGYNSHDLIAAMLYRVLQETDDVNTIRKIFVNMASKDAPKTAEKAMCDFQDAVNGATNNAFASRLVKSWGMPSANICNPTGGIKIPQGYTSLQFKHSGKCLDVSGARTGGDRKANGSNVHQWSCHNGDNQKFKLVEKGNGYYNIVAKHSNKCVVINGGSNTSNGANVHQWACSNGANRVFKLVDQGNNYFTLEAKHSDKCITVDKISRENGANLVQWQCRVRDNQRLRFR